MKCHREERSDVAISTMDFFFEVATLPPVARHDDATLIIALILNKDRDMNPLIREIERACFHFFLTSGAK
jgi:hypothetical protein